MKDSKVSLLLVAAVLLGIAVLSGSQAKGQTVTTGAITGTVTDPSGAVMAGVTVTASDKAAGIERTTTTNDTGNYRFSLLPPGVYGLQFSASGFKTAIAPPVTVIVTETTTVNLSMSVGEAQQTVDVNSEVQLVQTESATLGTVIDNRTLDEVPLTTRNYTQILTMSTGVVADVNNAAALGKGTQDVYVNGQSNISNNYQMDGSDINNFGSGRSGDFVQQAGIAIPNPDAIQEFKIQTTLYDAGYGRDAGANVDVVTKSGSNQVHGTLFEFFRNDVLNANDFFLLQNNQPRPVMKQNQFGGTVGGPIIKDRLFFFGSYQGSRQVNGLSPDSFSSNSLPPLTDDRSANAIGAIGCKEKTGFGGEQVACNGSNINPVALNLLNIKLPNGTYLIPTPQRITTDSSGNLAGFSAFSLPGHFTEDQLLINTDYDISPRHRLSERYFYARDPQEKPFSNCFTVACTPGSGLQSEFKNYVGSLKLTSTLSNSFVNEALVNFTRNTGVLTSDSKITDQSLGITPGDPGFPKMPTIAVIGEFSIGGNFNDDSNSTVNQYQFSDQIAWTRGKHTLRAGFQLERNQFAFNDPGPRRGILNFLTFPDFLLGLSAAQNGTPESNILVSVGIAGDLSKAYRATDYASFIQDDFKVAPRLTLNMGLRWEINGGISDANGRLSSVWPSVARANQPPPGGSTFAGFVVPSNFPFPIPAGMKKLSGKTLARTDTPLENLGPRFGFAWQPLPSTNRLVMRGGYGLFYTRPNGNAVLQTVVSQPFVSINGLAFAGNSLATFQVPFNPAPKAGVFTPRTTTSALTADYVAEGYDSPMTQQYSLDMEYEFAPKTLLEVGYVGTRGNRLAMTRNINESLLASPSSPVNGITTNTVANAGQRVPILGFAPNGLVSIETEGASMYNSLQVIVKRQFGHGVQFQGAYTYGKVMTNVEGKGFGAVFQGGDGNSNSPVDLRQQWGPADYDRTNRFIFNYLWELPHPKSGFLGTKVLGGWTFSGVTTIQSGDALTLTDPSGGSIFGGAGTSRAELCPGFLPGQIPTSGGVEDRLNNYFNAAAFCPPPAIGDGTGYGDTRRGTVRGPHQANLDAALSKRMAVRGLSEAGTLEFRSEFFNALNHPQFADPGVSLGSPSFGKIQSTSVAPRLIQFALKYSF